jgi:hypothetical protein
MPFTLCHPAALAALPARIRRRFPLAALAIGAMTPDFEYLLRLKPLSVWSHTLPGLFFFCVPVGLVAWIAWEQFARGPSRELLALRTERDAHRLTPTTLTVAALAVLIGACTHVLWDAFTHSGRLGAALIPQLEEEAWKIGTYSLRWFGVLQHLSTVVGAIVLGIWYLGERRRFASVWTWSDAGLRVLRIVAVGILVGLVNAFVPHTIGDARHPGTMGLLARFAVGGMVGTAVALLAYGAARREKTSM